MNLKWNFCFWREQESYSVSFYFLFKSVDCNATAENVRIYVFRSFSLYHNETSVNISFTAKSEHHVSFIIAFIEIEFRGVR
ncbi:hypothetical protein BKE81_22670 [Salmonella enterica]|nr:hypothetical protein [Salmonella enterica]